MSGEVRDGLQSGGRAAFNFTKGGMMKDNEIDKQVSNEVISGLLADGITQYPAICPWCHGAGCVDCDHQGIYELMVESRT